MISIDGTHVSTDHYTTISKKISGWNSPSGCYLQVQAPNKHVKVS